MIFVLGIVIGVIVGATTMAILCHSDDLESEDKIGC